MNDHTTNRLRHFRRASGRLPRRRTNYARNQVLTNSGALDRDKQLAVERQLETVAAAAGDPTLAGRTWVLLTEAPDGGWGLNGHANTNTELVSLARAQIAELQAGKSTR